MSDCGQSDDSSGRQRARQRRTNRRGNRRGSSVYGFHRLWQHPTQKDTHRLAGRSGNKAHAMTLVMTVRARQGLKHRSLGHAGAVFVRRHIHAHHRNSLETKIEQASAGAVDRATWHDPLAPPFSASPSSLFSGRRAPYFTTVTTRHRLPVMKNGDCVAHGGT